MHYISLYGALSLHNCSSSGSQAFAHLGGINKITHSMITQLTYVQVTEVFISISIIKHLFLVQDLYTNTYNIFTYLSVTVS